LPDPQSIPLPDDIPLPPEDNEPSQVDTSQSGDNNNKLDDDSKLMAQVMGFSSFNSTKGKMVPGNQTIGAVHVIKKRRYRQYMNRKGGFNRPLDKVA
jgi:U4/U6.U5 tri-snRNP-associated protein 3